jgi:hypothetical protein
VITRKKCNQVSLLIEDENILGEVAGMEPVPVDGLLGLVNLGDTFLTCYYRWVPLKFENGILVREKHVTLVITSPRVSVRPGGTFDTWLSAQRVVSDQEALATISLN